MHINQQRMGQAALLIIAGAVVSRIFGFIRETVIAYQFGATAQTDAYLVASVIPMLLSGIIVGAITVTFIPVFTEYRLRSGEREAWIIASTVANLTAIILVVGAAIYFLAAPILVPLLAPGLAPETMVLAINLSRLFAPAAIFIGLVGLAGIMLNAYKHFTFPAFAGLLYNFGIIGGALLLGGFMGISGLVVGVLAGSAAYMLALIIPLLGKRIYYRPTLQGLKHPGMKQIGALLLPVMVGSAAGQINLVVDRILASGLVEGSISALSFASRVTQLPINIFVLATATAVYPFLAEQAATERFHDLRRTFSEALRMLMFIIFPLSVGLIILAQPIIRLLFERGAFDATATQLTAIALLYYALGIFAHAAYAHLIRVYYSLQDTLTPVKIGIVGGVLNIALNLILVRYLAHGGLALASSIAITFNCLMLTYFLRSRLVHLDGRRILLSFTKFAVASLAMGLAVAAAYRYSAPFFNLDLLSHQLLQVGGLITLGGMVYFAVAALLKTEELAALDRRAGFHRFRQYLSFRGRLKR